MILDEDLQRWLEELPSITMKTINQLGKGKTRE
jgi:hypothetical protein